MKPKIILLSVLSAIFFASLPQIHVQAADLSLGAVSWYAWWVTPFNKEIKGGAQNASKGIDVNMNNSNVLYGPVMSIKFNDMWNVSALFVFSPHGGYGARSDFLAANVNDFSEFDVYLNSKFGTSYMPVLVEAVRVNVHYIKRYDLDLTADCWLNKSFKIFFGFKYQGYKMLGDMAVVFLNPQPIPGLSKTMYSKYHLFGGGLGIGTTIHLVDSLFLVGNLSGFLLEGLTFFKHESFREQRNGTSTYGTNGNLSFAYYIEDARTTLSLGYRAQVNWYGKPDLSHDSVTNTGLFHGLMLSVIYTI
ncbi:MAG: hypothetical protein MUD12_07865 [Spirochaetes bacterium]|jgi:hypothetical protein|nr:hypothetical protein [Spirochaetota bacterium]